MPARRFVLLSLAMFVAMACVSERHEAFSAEDVTLNRWAIIAAHDELPQKLGDLLTVQLSQQDDLELVERERLDDVLDEIAISSLFGSKASAQRISIGKLLRADGLILLSVERRGEKSVIKTVMSESKYGLRLLVQYHPIDRDPNDIANHCVTSLESTRARFANGLRQIIAAPSFLSKNLSHDWDHLQAGYATLLQSALLRHPGVAVIETEEARLLGKEAQLGAVSIKNRAALIFVAGEFRMKLPTADQPAGVSLLLNISDAAGEIRQIRHDNVELDQVPTLLLGEVPRRILRIADTTSIRPLSAESQVAHLTSAANRFSEVGAWEHSIGLREAALLIKPADSTQRVALIADYRRWQKVNRETLVNDFFRRSLWDTWEEIARKEPAACEAVYQKIAQPWRITLNHFVHLVHAKQVNPREAAYLLAGIREDLEHLLLPSRQPLPHAEFEVFCEAAQRLGPSVSRLDCSIADGTLRPAVRAATTVARPAGFGEDPWRASRQYDVWASEILYSLGSPDISRGLGIPHYELDRGAIVARVFHFLTEHARIDRPPVSFVGELFGPRRELNTWPAADSDALYARLLAADSPRANFYGRYGRWGRAVSTNSQDESPAEEAAFLLRELEKLQAPFALNAAVDNPFREHLSKIVDEANAASEGQPAKR